MDNFIQDDLAMQLQKAYILLKKSLYYENNSLLHIKYQIVKFEAQNMLLIEEKRNSFFNKLANEIEKESCIEELLQKVNYKKIIKKLDENSNEIKYNYIIDCPIELHLISLLWIFNLGTKLDNNIEKCSYGYRLEKNMNKSIFKKYVKQYQMWLENGLKIAEELIEKDEDIVLIKIDLKRYYYNIAKDKLLSQVEQVEKKFVEDKWFKIVMRINEKYTEILKSSISENDKKNFGNYFLPIGLYSSAILSNIYLKDFDKKILDSYPDYYGRYVDDIFIVVRERNLQSQNEISKYLEDRFFNVFNKKNLKELKLNKSFEFNNNEKIMMEIINGKLKKIKFKESREKFLQKPSPFSYLPNKKEIIQLYDKITLLKNREIKEQKFDVSVYLSKILYIFHSVQGEEFDKELKEIIKNIMEFFNDKNIIKYYIYFEKIFTILLLTENISLFNEIFINIKNTLDNYKMNDKDIKEYFLNSLKFSISLNPKFVKKNNKNFKNNFFMENEDNELMSEILDIVNSNMFKGNKVIFSLLNYIKLKKNRFRKCEFFKK